MSSPSRFYPPSARPYQHRPHVAKIAITEAKRQPNVKRRSIALRALRQFKIQARWVVSA